MAEIGRKKTPGKTLGKLIKKGFFNQFKLSESYVSLVIGAIVVVVIGIIIFSFVGANRDLKTSSTTSEQKTEQESADASDTSSAYTVKPGDDLWSISENIYNDGYKWVDIARVNKLQNPDVIHSGDKLSIPRGREEKPAQESKVTQTITSEISANNSITASTYSVVRGDNLWNIAVRAYGDGFRWSDIAKANNLVNPNLIHSGNFFKIPR